MKGKVFVTVLVAAFVSLILANNDGSAVYGAESNRQMIAKVHNAVYQNGSNLDINTIEMISGLHKQNAGEVKQEKVIDALVLTGANCLDDHAGWTDRNRGRRVYELLKRYEGDLVTGSLVRQVLGANNRLHVLFLGVKLGIGGSEEKLNVVLMNHGNKSMAEDFLNSGSQGLYDGGKRWANSHGYSIHTGMGSHRVAWGRF